MSGSQSGGVALPTLILTGGPLDGTTYPLRMNTREVSLGSGGQTDIQIALGNVDPVHARLVFGTGGLSITDAGSATGTFLNGEKVQGEQLLQDGDRICLGPPGARESAKLLVRLPGGPIARAPGPTTAAGAPSFLDTEPGPVLLGEDDHLPVSLDNAAAWPPAPPPAPPPPAQREEEDILASEDVVVDDSAAGPPLGADEVPTPQEEEPLFATPLPPAPPSARPPAPPPPAPSAPAFEDEPLTAPPPDDEPSVIRLAPLEEEEAPAPPAPAPPVPSPRPTRAAPSAARGRRPARRVRRSSLPVVPVLGGLAALLAVGAGGWWFFLRPTPSTPATIPPAARPPAAAPGRPAAAPGRPQVTALEPDVALPGETIQIRGQVLKAPVSVTIAGAPAEVAEATEETIRIVVPNLALGPGQKAEVVVTAGSFTSPPLELILGHLPLILEVAPGRGPVGEKVVLTGRGFDSRPNGNAVTFGGAPALVLAASPTELTVVAPSPATSGTPDVPVVVSAGGRTSGRGRTYTLVRGVASTFVPRFFAAPVTERPGADLAFVATEIAPVLLLGGASGRTSTAVRAAEVAATLNQLVERAASKRVEIELRERPSPAVAVVGEARPFLSATAADAAAYATGWEPGARRGLRLNDAAITRHWAALLKDYFGLFLYRERPLEVAALSPRGRVFMDIYAEATRRASGGTGVPAGVVYPPTERIASELRLAALVPTGGRVREAIAVEGRWSGTIEDPNTGSRRFEVRFEPSGAGLDGEIKTWRGGLELRSPLRDISFSHGTLRFTTDLQGTPHRFEGTLHDTSITGSAAREGRTPAPFSLEFVE